MKLPSIKSISPNRKIYRILDFCSMTDFAVSAVATKDEITAGKTAGAPVYTKHGFSAIRSYRVDGRRLYYFADGFVREFDEEKGEYKKVLLNDFDAPPKIFCAFYRGAKTLFVYGDGYAFSSEKNFDAIKIPDGKLHVAFKGGLYFVDGKTVFFCKDFFRMPKKKIYCFVRADKDEGEVVGIAEIYGKLYVFFERAIYLLSYPFDSENAEFTKLIETRILSDSFCIVNGTACFIANGALSSFDGKKITELTPFQADKNVGEAREIDGAYTIETLIKNDKMLFHYALGKEEAGYYIHVNDGEFISLEMGAQPNGTWISKTTNFGDKGSKTLREVTVKGIGKVCVTLIADGKERTICPHINGVVRLAVTAQNFAIKISGIDSLNKVQEVQFIYGE